MDNKKPVYWLLCLSAAFNGVYLLLLLLMTAFRAPLVELMYGTAVKAPEDMIMSVPYLFLGRSIAASLAVFCFAFWIYAGAGRRRRLLLPCILWFICVGLSPAAGRMGTSVENMMAARLGTEGLIDYSQMTGLYSCASMFSYVGTILLTVGAALALYRDKYIINGRSI